jgi:hypothetical protein
MSNMEFFYCCRVCAENKTLEELRAYRPTVTVEGNTTRWDCPECGRNIMISIDGGTLDLGLVRDEDLGDMNDFEVMTNAS